MTIDQNPNSSEYRIEGLTLRPELSVDRLRRRRDLLAQLNEQIETNADTFAALDNNNKRAFQLLTSAAEQRGGLRNIDDAAAVTGVVGIQDIQQQFVIDRRRVI